MPNLVIRETILENKSAPVFVVERDDAFRRRLWGEDVPSVAIFYTRHQADEFLRSQRVCSCQNCNWSGPESDLKNISDIFERVAPGEPMPAGECPACGALAHID